MKLGKTEYFGNQVLYVHCCQIIGASMKMKVLAAEAVINNKNKRELEKLTCKDSHNHQKWTKSPPWLLSFLINVSCRLKIDDAPPPFPICMA